jgi:hypothetical protein
VAARSENVTTLWNLRNPLHLVSSHLSHTFPTLVHINTIHLLGSAASLTVHFVLFILGFVQGCLACFTVRLLLWLQSVELCYRVNTQFLLSSSQPSTIRCRQDGITAVNIQNLNLDTVEVTTRKRHCKIYTIFWTGLQKNNLVLRSSQRMIKIRQGLITTLRIQFLNMSP